MTRSLTCLTAFTLALLALLTSSASALIMIGRGNTPVHDSDWPAGSLDVANLKTRLGWWEGPPFGGGQWQFLYRSDTAQFQEALDLFAKIRAPELHLIIREGPQTNQFLKDDRDPNADTRIDWTFTVWTPANWNALYNNPNSIFGAQDPSGAFRNPVAPPILIVYLGVGGGIDWKSIKIPDGLTIMDERATANGYAPEDGSVLRGDAYDMKTSKPIPELTISLEKYNGTAYEQVTTGKADNTGRFEIKQLPAGSYRITFAAPNYVTRSMGHIEIGPNTLLKYTPRLSQPVTVKGAVHDTEGKPLTGVKVRADSVMGADGRGYLLPATAETTTDAQGNFELPGLPKGFLQLFSSADNYYPQNSLRIIESPSSNLALVMTATGSIKGTVTKPDGTPAATGNVNVRPVGEVIGQVGGWGGGMNIRPDGTFEFKNVPPGKYILSTDPRSMLPGSPPDPFARTVDVTAGQSAEVQLTTK